MDGFNRGLTHPFFEFEQLLALLALGLMLGLRWPKRFAASWAVFALTMLAGIVLGHFVVTIGEEVILLLFVAVLAAALAALYPTGIPTASIILCGLGGLSIGFMSMPEDGTMAATIVTLLGSYVGANLAISYIAVGVGWISERYSWNGLQIGFRIVAAWIAAISVIILALYFAPD